jgi:hypothetical protein
VAGRSFPGDDPTRSSPSTFTEVDAVFLRRLYILIVIEHGRRRVHVAGITTHAARAWVI